MNRAGSCETKHLAHELRADNLKGEQLQQESSSPSTPLTDDLKRNHLSAKMSVVNCARLGEY